jgi:hypothetical protein
MVGQWNGVIAVDGAPAKLRRLTEAATSARNLSTAPTIASGASCRPTSRSLRTHSVRGPEITARVGDECTIGGMVYGLNRRDPLDELGVVAVDVLDQFGLGIRRTGDQYCAGGPDCTDHVLKEGVIFGGVSAADRIGFVMNVSGGMLRMYDDLVNIRRVEMKHSRFMVINPDGSVIVVRQDVLRNGNFQGKESELQRPTVRTKYALRDAYVGSIPKNTRQRWVTSGSSLRRVQETRLRRRAPRAACAYAG